MAAAKKVATKSAGDVHRVYKIDEQLREQIKTARTASGLVSRDWLAGAVNEQLPAVVAELKTLGIVPSKGKQRPARLPLSDALIGSLKQAAAETGLPQALLLIVAMRRQAGRATKPSKLRGRRRKSSNS